MVYLHILSIIEGAKWWVTDGKCGEMLHVEIKENKQLKVKLKDKKFTESLLLFFFTKTSLE